MLKIDEPIIFKDNNLLYAKAEGIKKLIETNTEFLRKNNLVALYGEWGSGKSSIFRTLKEELNTEKYIPLIFQAWKYEKDSNLPLSLYDFILDNIIENKEALKIVSKEIVRKGLYSFFKGISFDFGFISIDNEKVVNSCEEDKVSSLYSLTENFLDNFREQIDKYREEKQIIIFIDDLDRCDDENIISFLSALKLMFSVENIIFICGIDKNAIEQTLIGRYNNEEKAQKYLEKIFPINFNIENNIKIKDFFDPNEDLAEFKFQTFKGLGEENPRNIIRILNKFNILCQLIPFDEILDKYFRNKKEIPTIKIIAKVYLFLKLTVSELKLKNNKNQIINIDNYFHSIDNKILMFKENKLIIYKDSFRPNNSTFFLSFIELYKNINLTKSFNWYLETDEEEIRIKILNIFSIEFYKYY